jgi:6-phosphogluconolactonase/glucosamine-6-phosphate isomerase/deaminase
MAQQTDISKMETTQTAVEWLIHQLNTRQKPLDNSQIDELFEQAKEIEKQQMKDAVLYGLDEDGHTGDWKISVAENYYIKTYTK